MPERDTHQKDEPKNTPAVAMTIWAGVEKLMSNVKKMPLIAMMVTGFARVKRNTLAHKEALSECESETVCSVVGLLLSSVIRTQDIRIFPK